MLTFKGFSEGIWEEVVREVKENKVFSMEEDSGISKRKWSEVSGQGRIK